MVQSQQTMLKVESKLKEVIIFYNQTLKTEVLIKLGSSLHRPAEPAALQERAAARHPAVPPQRGEHRRGDHHVGVQVDMQVDI